MHAAEYPTWFPAKRVHPFGPPLDNEQWNEKCEESQMQEKCFPFQFVHRESEEARDEDVDTRNETWSCHYCHDFSHELFWSNFMLMLRFCLSPGRLTGEAHSTGYKRTGGPKGFSPWSSQVIESATHLSKMREHVGADLLMFLLLRWTGLRGVDAVKLTWSEVHLDRKEIERVTQKRKKRVILPMHTKLLFALEIEHEKMKPEPSARVLLNLATGAAMTRPRLYSRVLALGKRACVAGAHPHRFRDTLAVDMLSRDASPYDIAKMLGDTIDTVEKHYTAFVKKLRDRLRNILETGTGIEEAAKMPSEARQNVQRKPQ